MLEKLGHLSVTIRLIEQIRAVWKLSNTYLLMGDSEQSFSTFQTAR
jgi:hypothetical protein